MCSAPPGISNRRAEASSSAQAGRILVLPDSLREPKEGFGGGDAVRRFPDPFPWVGGPLVGDRAKVGCHLEEKLVS